MIPTTAWWNTQNNEGLRDCAFTSSAAHVDMSNCCRPAHGVCKGQDVIKRLNFTLWHLEVRLRHAQQQNLTIHAELSWCFYRTWIFGSFWGINALLHHFCIFLTSKNPVLSIFILTQQLARVWGGTICVANQWQMVEMFGKTIWRQQLFCDVTYVSFKTLTFFSAAFLYINQTSYSLHFIQNKISSSVFKKRHLCTFSCSNKQCYQQAQCIINEFSYMSSLMPKRRW